MLGNGVVSIISTLQVLVLMGILESEMKVKYYFYSGNTQIINGNSTQFSGVYEADSVLSAVDVYYIIIDAREDLHKRSVVLTSFNCIGEQDE